VRKYSKRNYVAAVSLICGAITIGSSLLLAQSQIDVSNLRVPPGVEQESAGPRGGIAGESHVWIKLVDQPLGQRTAETQGKATGG